MNVSLASPLQWLGRIRAAVVRRPALWVGLLFCTMLLIGILALGMRSPGLDYEPEMRILESNIKVYVELFTGTDSPLYQSFDIEGDIRTSIERDHGESALYPLWVLLRLAKHCFGASGLHCELLSFFYFHLLFLLALYALYRIVWQLTASRGWGIVGMLLLYLNPRFFAESFYNNKDLVLLSLCLIVFWTGLGFLHRTNWISCVFFGAAGAFAFNTRLLGIAAFGVCGLVYLADLTIRRRWSRRMFLRGALAVASFLLVYYIITPACWSHPVEFFRYVYTNTTGFDISRWNNTILYRGDWFNPASRPLPWHYIPWLICITTPLPILALAVLWLLKPVFPLYRSLSERLDQNTLYEIGLLFFAAVPLLASMIGGANLYNGWRHLYFVYGAIVALAACSAAWLWKLHKRWLRPLLTAVLCANLLYYGGFIAVNYPHEYAYFNFLAGEHPEESYDADYWMISLRPVLLELLERDTFCSVTDIGPVPRCRYQWYHMSDYPIEIQEREEEVTWDRRNRAVYVVENTSYWKLERLQNTWAADGIHDAMQEWIRVVRESEVVYEAKCGRTVLWRVYKNPQYNGSPVEW